MSNIVNVAWMYPDILNLHGERGNAKAFELVSKKMGVKLNIDRIDDIDSNINYENYDILLFNAKLIKYSVSHGFFTSTGPSAFVNNKFLFLAPSFFPLLP